MNAYHFPMNPVAQAVTDYRSHHFSHPYARQTFKQLGTEMGAVSAPQVIILTGPTGVGKSTLMRAASNQLIANLKEQIQAEPDFVPIVALSAATPNGTSISWKDLYIRLLTGQNEPLVDRKLYLPRQMPLLADGYPSNRGLEQSVTDALRRAVEEHLKRRGVRLLVIDEAQHLLLTTNAHRLECQFESLKFLAAETGTTILLVGTYRLLDILDQSAQLTRRSLVVNFPRYDMRNEEDREGFLKILEHLSVKLSEHVPTDLTKDVRYYYRKSAGCVGILKDWLARCLEYAMTENVKRIDSHYANRFALPNRGLVTIIEEACWGEDKLLDVDDSMVIDLLENGPAFVSAEKPSPSVRRPGTRKPKRDQVGEALA